MATAPHRPRSRMVDYPTGDGKPMAETDIHRDDMVDLIQTLKHYFVAEPMIYVSGNLLMFYEEGNRRKHVSPDVFVVRDVENRLRDNYLVWEEGKAPDAVIELTSRSTKHEDQVKKRERYRDVLRVPEYFMFDPAEDYLKPPLQGFRLVDGEYIPIEPVDGRVPSEVLGLHLEQHEHELRLYDPARRARLLKPAERTSAAEASAREAEAEVVRLRQEIETIRTRTGSGQ
jgi:Uma2 family endonuclease